jgi:hypothetical protein
MDCGANERELGDWERGEHEYGEYLVMGLPLMLCDFCDADLPSYRADYLGIQRPIRDQDIKLVRKVPDAALAHDWVCPRCERRLAFLSFLVQLRERHAA